MATEIVKYPNYTNNLGVFTVNTVYSSSSEEFTFTGTNKISLADSTVFTTLTFCCWIYRTNTRDMSILDRSSWFAISQTDFPCRFDIVNNKLSLKLSTGNNFSWALNTESNTTIELNTWYHVGFVYSPTNYAVYINGIVENSGSLNFSIFSNTSRFWTLGAPTLYNSTTENSINFIGKMRSPIFAPNVYNTELIKAAATNSTTPPEEPMELLTSDRSYYVRTDGNDSNTGLANNSSEAFLTIQKAINAASKLNFNGFSVTINIANGTYNITTPLVSKDWIGEGTLTVKGESNTSTIIDLVSIPTNTHACCIVAISNTKPIIWERLLLRSTATGNRSGDYFNCLVYAASAGVANLKELNFGNIAHGNPYGATLMCETKAIISFLSSTFIVSGAYSASAGTFYYAWNLVRSDGLINYLPLTIFNSNSVTRNYRYFFWIYASQVQCWTGSGGVNFSAFSVSATKYDISANGVLNTFNTLNGVPGSGANTASGGIAI